MKTFLLRLWVYVRPYRTRFILGSVCGLLYGVTNGALIIAVNSFVNVVFTGTTHFQEQLKHWNSSHFHSLTEYLKKLPEIKAPAEGDYRSWALLFCILPAIMFLRVMLGYLNVYLTNWVAAHAVADIRTKLFAHL